MKLLFFGFFVLLTFSSVAQGFNNDQKIDQEDLKMLFRQNRLTPFKFSFSSKSDSALNIIIEKYIDGKLVAVKNFYEDTKKIIAMGDEPKSYYYPALNGKVKPLARIYFDENNNDTLRIWVHLGPVEKRFSFPVSEQLITESRAFDDIPAILRKKIPVVVFYGNEAMMISCPGDAKPSDIVKMYKLAIIVYAAPVKP